MEADDSNTLDAAAWAELWASGRTLPPDHPLELLDELLLAVGMLNRLGDPGEEVVELERRLEELGEIREWGEGGGTGGSALSEEERAKRESRIGFARQALLKVSEWGCTYNDAVVRVPDGSPGRPVALLTVVVGLLREAEGWGADYSKILGEIRLYWPDATREQVQEAAKRFRADRRRYDRAFGRLSPGSDMDWG